MLNEPPIALLDTITAIDDAIDENADIADAIVDLALQTVGLQSPEDGSPNTDWHNSARAQDLNKAHSTVRQFWRDWSLEGYTAEVKPILDLVLQDLKGWLAVRPHEANILVPGAGLGRLMFELCLRGFNVEGNELSYHQLFASHFILNSTQHAGQFVLHPNITTFTNHRSRSAQLAAVSVPDIHPSSTMLEQSRLAEQDKTGETPAPGQMNMTAGDFITSYGKDSSREQFDAVVTVYFLDTAPNVLRYIETIRNCLRDQGVWINVGPLLWHFDDRIVDNQNMRSGRDEEDVDMRLNAREGDGIAEPGSVELTDEELQALVVKMGFEIVKYEQRQACEGGYISDPASMLQSLYRNSHWVAKKR